MPVEPTYKIFSTPAIRKEENVSLSQRKKQRPKKKEEKKDYGKVDIKV